MTTCRVADDAGKQPAINAIHTIIDRVELRMYMGFSDAQHSICANGDQVGPKSKLMSALSQKQTFLAVNCDICFTSKSDKSKCEKHVPDMRH